MTTRLAGQKLLRSPPAAVQCARAASAGDAGARSTDCSRLNCCGGMASNSANPPATVVTMGELPAGAAVCATLPDLLYLPELVFGGLVWILVASTLAVPQNPLGWVMAVSVFCFVATFLWSLLFLCGCHSNKSRWAAADFVYHLTAAVFYLSASVSLAKVTLDIKDAGNFRNYQLDISAVVFSYAATLLYFVHGILSAMRWKTF